jgi:hypothetical protein
MPTLQRLRHLIDGTAPTPLGAGVTGLCCSTDGCRNRADYYVGTEFVACGRCVAAARREERAAVALAARATKAEG